VEYLVTCVYTNAVPDSVMLQLRHDFYNINFDVLLTVHLSIFILVINQLDVQNLFYNKFFSCLYMFRASCAHRQEVKIVLYSIWYHQTYRWPSRARETCRGMK